MHNETATIQNKALMRRIMRRTYYAFVIHAATRKVVRYGVPLVLCAYLAAKLVFVAAVFANAKAAGITNLHSFVYGAVTHADVLSLLVAAALMVVSLGIARDAAQLVAKNARVASV
ncbi:MAG: hypothetical protein RLZZ234_454 [Candidatus Parcubacteria bacterium]